jgi:hypothetical protein
MTRLSAFGGLAFAATLAAGFLLDLAIFLTTGGPPQLFVSTLSADLARASTSVVWRVELWTYILAAIPFVVFLPGLRHALDERGNDVVSIGALMAALFILLHTLHNMAYAAIVTGLAPDYVAGSATAPATLETSRGLIALAETAFLPGGGIGALALVFALVIFGIAQRRSGARRTSGVALAAAVLTSAGYLRLVVPDMVVLPVALAGWVAFIAWSAMSSLDLLRANASAWASASSREARSSEAAAASHAG